MKIRICFAVLFINMIIFMHAYSFQENGTPLRRFGFFIGENDGGHDLEPLRYAVRDAESVSRLFMEMGGIKQQDNIFLVEPSLEEIQGKLKTLKTKLGSLRSKYSRLELIFYYSGHSDEEGLLVSKDKFSYKDLKDAIRDMPVDMRIVILDSCSSGALTKLKGGTRQQAFLMDNSIKMEGYAIMTSSSSDEASQESDSLKGSYFTYALISGLRGAADTGGNKTVTLNQAYQYAYRETLAKTEKTLGGAQHPSYDIRMNGSGDVVLTDLRRTTASLKLAPDISGRLNIRDDSGILVAEINKVEGSTVELGMEPGPYKINVEIGRKDYQGEITINENESAVFSKDLLAEVSTEKTTMRGNENSADQTNKPSENYITIPFSLTVLPLLNTTSNKTIINLELNIGAGYCDRLEGTAIGFVNITGENAKYLDLSLTSLTFHDFTGFEASLLAFTGHDFKGAQLSLVNIVMNDFDSFQSGLANIDGRDFHGVQLGLVNIDGNNFNGFQAGLVNIIGNSFSGFQAGLANLDIYSFNGPEIGLLNINTEVSGLQLGLINFSTGLNGEAIGLISVVLSNGQTHLEAWADETGFLNIALINGSRTVYNIYTIGIDTAGTYWTYGLGLGLHIPADPFYINVEIIDSSVSHIAAWDGNNTLGRFRVYAGFSIFEHLSVIAGVSLNYYRNWNGNSAYVPSFNISKSFADGGILWPGIFAGLQF